MKKVVVASQNPVKINVARRAFERVFPEDIFECLGVSSESGVSDQPMNDATITGAKNRLAHVKENFPEADFWISQEGGVYEEGNRFYNQAWIMICDKNGYTAQSSTGIFYLPKNIVEAIRNGKELGHAADAFFDTTNVKHGMSTIGCLTDGLIDREHLYLPAAIIALSEIKHKEWYL